MAAQAESLQQLVRFFNADSTSAVRPRSSHHAAGATPVASRPERIFPDLALSASAKPRAEAPVRANGATVYAHAAHPASDHEFRRF
jgi:hypothetical protein